MAENVLSRRMPMRIAYFAIAAVIVFFHLLPLSTMPPYWAPPDLLLGITFAWLMRRPDYVPMLSIAAVMLMADLMFQRPPGLMALLAVLGCEYLRTRAANLREASFAGEWLAVCLTLAAITLANRMILALLGVAQAQFGLALMQMLATMIAYPAIVLVSQWLLGIRKPAPGDAGALGVRP